MRNYNRYDSFTIGMIIFVLALVVGASILVAVVWHRRTENAHACEAKGGTYVRVYNYHYKCLDIGEVK